jgi:asparagine synthase (glutamine-hydrolysing)
MTREHVTVALDGGGGDELLAGYERQWAAKTAARLDVIPQVARELVHQAVPLIPEPKGRRAMLRRAKRFLSVIHLDPVARYMHWIGAWSASQKEALYTSDYRAELGQRDPLQWMREAMEAEPGLSALDKALRADTVRYLADDTLVKMDIASMACSLEVRSPLLDHRLVEFCASLPGEYKLHGRTSKWLLRRHLEGKMPPQIMTRHKMGFGMPVAEWLRGELRPLLEDLVLSDRAVQRGYFKPDALRRVVDEHVSGRVDRTYHLWALLTLEMWFREVVERPRNDVAATAVSA